MADPMKIRANVAGDSTEVKVLMSHEMETGQRKDAQGKVDPRVVHPERAGDVQRQDRAVARSGGRRSRRIRFSRSSSRVVRRATRCSHMEGQRGEKRTDEATIGCSRRSASIG